MQGRKLRLAKSLDRHEGREVKLSYVHGVGTTPLIADTIGGALNGAAERWGDRDALVACHQQLRYSYRELRDEADRAARALIALGVQRGDRVGIWSGNRAEWMVTQYAAAKAGAVLVNINPAYRLRELEYALSHSGLSVLIAARRFRSTDYVETLLRLIPELRSTRTGPIQAQQVPAIRRVVYLGTEAEPGGIAWAEFLDLADRVSASELEARETALQFDDPVNIQYTSGTTGSPKGATLSHHNILNNGYFVGEVLRYTERDRICLPVPFYHCFGCVLGNMAAVTHGSAVVIPGESFDPDATLQAIQNHGCTSIYGVPTMFIAQLEHPRFSSVRLETLRTGIMAGAPCPIDVMRQVIDRMHVPQVTICYGMTETSPVSFQSETDDPIELRVSTVGRVLPHLECKIVDPETGLIVPRGTPGELCTRGYAVMLGYLYIRNVSAFQSIFKYFEQLRAKADETVDAVSELIAISNLDDFRAACTSQMQMMSKLAQIARQPYLSRVTMADIRRTIDAFELQVEIVRDKGEDKLLFEQSPQKRWLILKLLDDDFLGSVMTNEKYEVNSKSVLRRQ